MARLEEDISFDWNPDRVLAEVNRRLERGIERACMFVVGRIIASISTGQPASAPGEPPHVLLGRLRQSITHRVFQRAGEWVGVVGTNVIYARRLELGFVGTDARGRNVNQAPRPFIRPAILNNRAEILRLIARG